MIYDFQWCEIAVKMDILGAKLRMAQKMDNLRVYYKLNFKFTIVYSIIKQLSSRMRAKEYARNKKKQCETEQMRRRNTNQMRYV